MANTVSFIVELEHCCLDSFNKRHVEDEDRETPNRSTTNKGDYPSYILLEKEYT